jgi:hypothetical protein
LVFQTGKNKILKTKLLKFGLNFLLPDREKIHLLPGKSRVEIKILLCVLCVEDPANRALSFVKEVLDGVLDGSAL